MRIRDLDKIANSLNAAAAGQAVTGCQVFGPNSLKTLVGPDSLVGDALRHVDVDTDKLAMSFGQHKVWVDLQRAGALVWLTEPSPWAIGARTPMPTVRVLLGKIGFDFTEPGKTKRIAVWIDPVGT